MEMSSKEMLKLLSKKGIVVEAYVTHSKDGGDYMPQHRKSWKELVKCYPDDSQWDAQFIASINTLRIG